MIYAFCSDSSFEGLDGGNIITHSDLSKAGLGVMTDQMVNYFFKPAVLVDPKTNGNNTRIVFASFGNKANGKMLLQFDNAREDIDIAEHVRPSYLSSDEAAGLDEIAGDSSKSTNLFNIIETCFLLRELDNTTPATETRLDEKLTAESSAYAGYVGGSIKTSVGTTPSKIRLVTGVTENEYHFYNSVSFSFKVSNSITLEFKIWLGQQAFLDEYPKTTLVKVVWPCDPAKLLDMDFANNVDTLVRSSQYKNEQLAAAIHNEDHSGLATYNSKYVNSSVPTYYNMPFTILYKGCIPSAANMREYVQAELLALNLASEVKWKAVLPDLFVDAGFYLIPMYQQRVSYLDGYKLDRSIIDYSSIAEKVSALYPEVNTSVILQRGMLLRAAGSDLYIFAFPMASNDAEHMSLLPLYPYYQAIDANNSNWQTMGDKTQQFAVSLAYCIKVALGLTANNTNQFTEEVIDNHGYYSFVVNSIEYHLLKQEEVSA